MEEVTLYIKPKNKRIIREVFYISDRRHYKSLGCPYCKIWKKKKKLGCNLCAKAISVFQSKFDTIGEKMEEISYYQKFYIMPKRFYVL